MKECTIHIFELSDKFRLWCVVGRLEIVSQIYSPVLLFLIGFQ